MVERGVGRRAESIVFVVAVRVDLDGDAIRRDVLSAAGIVAEPLEAERGTGETDSGRVDASENRQRDSGAGGVAGRRREVDINIELIDGSVDIVYHVPTESRG